MKLKITLAVTLFLFVIVAIGVFAYFGSKTANQPETAQAQTIMFCNAKIGEIVGGRVVIPFDGYTYSFAADTQSPDFLSGNGLTIFGGCGPGGGLPANWNDLLTYKRLIIHLPNPAELALVTYACDAPLAGKLYTNCDTNGKDIVSEYEFGAGYTSKINGTEDDYDQSYRWEKVIVKKIGDKNVIFEGMLNSPSGQSWVWGTQKCTDNPHYLCQTDEERNSTSVDPASLFAIYESLRQFDMVPDMNLYANTITYDTTAPWYVEMLKEKDSMLRSVQSSEYLFHLIQEPDNTPSIQAWDGIINSFTVTKGG